MDLPQADVLELEKLRSFSEINPQYRIAFKSIEANSTLLRAHLNEIHKCYIAHHLFHIPEYFDGIISYFASEIPKLLSIAIFFDDEFYKFNTYKHLLNCILLAKVVNVRPDLSGFALKYFNLYASPFESDFEEQRPGNGKKQRFSENVKVSTLDVVEACYSLLKNNPDFYGKKWHWSQFLSKYAEDADTSVRWIACQCLGIVFKYTETQLESLIVQKCGQNINQNLTCTFTQKGTLVSNIPKVEIDQHPTINLCAGEITQTINVSGVYIQTIPHFLPLKTTLVEVESTVNNLRKIALGLNLQKAICLQGPVGSGKTSLVEYLAAKTGHILGDNFVKVQLGDQTDSKMLLGTYRCTDIPGEFIWQPGVLTQAVMEGNWLLLEDIDSASMDIASVLSSLLENKALSVPGFRDNVQITPGFQLFLTHRLVSTITGHHKKQTNATMLLEKQVLQINIDPLTAEELKTILKKQYFEFRTITDRMVNVFQLFNTGQLSDEIKIPKSGRLISTRDFFKWCARAIVDFDVRSQTSALKVLQDAIDVFCCSFSNVEEALNLARQISTQLGIVNQKADYFFNDYKPIMQLTNNALVAGRGKMVKNTNSLNVHSRQSKFSFTRPSAVLLERIMCCITLKEPVLLVGETGTGKTSTIQYLANTIGQKLIVINMNQQSDSADLLGGFKPVDLKFVVTPIKNEFEHIFCDFFKIEPNKKFLSNISLCYNSERWSDLVKLMQKSYQAAIERLNLDLKKGGTLEKFRKRWLNFGEKLNKLALQIRQKTALAFAFVEGSLVKAVEEGHWVLLDEINLANAETLECLSGLLEGSQGSLCLLERGDKKPVKRHPNFTLFACMNPSTDVGKKELPPGLRNRFTEFFVDELTEKNDLMFLVASYLEAASMKEKDLEKIVEFYLKVRKDCKNVLSDGTGQKPHFSLRSLCRALMIASKNPCGTFRRSLYESFCLSFLTQLDGPSYKFVENLISSYLVGDARSLKAVLKQPIPEPLGKENYLQFEGYWVQKGFLDSLILDDYILTDSVRKNLKDLVRVVSIGKLPVLLQGDTSVGKTSLISYLAKASGNKCVRINNHEHTDLQEYIGSYVADSNGKLVFREGLLVQAMRTGHWIILDELNLAPSDVLEALNRVLDDNRELFIPETQEVIKADPNFMLFATQNPPGSYGGRKVMSRAFRNRFVELHFTEIPPNELEIILHKRCSVPPSYAKKMINIMTDLQMRRRGSAAFAGKQGFMTLRDLFRWGERYRLAEIGDKLYDWDQHLADEGYLVLAGKVRNNDEKKEIIAVLQKHLKREVKPYLLFTLTEKTSRITKPILQKIDDNKSKYPNIVWTYSMRQLGVLVAKALQFKEPVLLVGETGGGKTTVCQLIAENNGQKLVTVNCHMHTESSDFIGGLRPVREHSENETRLFEWVNGPLIDAMTSGNLFLADEISLADDSVLERLNSLLEPERSLLIAEKGSDLYNPENSELIIANEKFHFIGTMNPGGDFGKKELSPALRNRFTEIWCETCTNRSDLIDIIEQNIRSGLSFGNQEDGTSGIGSAIMDFIEFLQNTEIGKRFTISIRDILTWVNFINTSTKSEKINIADSFLHGANLTFLDSLGSGSTSVENSKNLQKFRLNCEKFIFKQVEKFAKLTPTSSFKIEETKNHFGINPFFIQNGPDVKLNLEFNFDAPTTIFNTLRLLRGMQLNKAILLEGSPGVGKTSLVTALAKMSGHNIFRVNLSDQTDISDLFGADLPVEGGTGGQFSWRDGPLLQALKKGHWILLDELNLASQSVLEGLNACLDHRGEIFIPELGKTFTVTPGTRFFGAQNPLKQGGSRRGLPKSFLNRFIQVYVNVLTSGDLRHILAKQFPNIGKDIINKMIIFNDQVVKELESYNFGSKGGPWEYNLRDLTRWSEAILFHAKNHNCEPKPESTVFLIYGDRLRTIQDKTYLETIFEQVFKCKISGSAPIAYVTRDLVRLGDISVVRDGSVPDDNSNSDKTSLVLRSQLTVLRSLAYCVNHGWMSILVGTSGSGKSSVVKTLASLAGKTLKTLPVTSAMDTTDILGGFEQTDYTRHLDEVAKETQNTLHKCVQQLCLNGKTRETVVLLDLWETFIQIQGKSATMEENVEIFALKIKKLQNIWDHLYKNEVDVKKIESLRKKAALMVDFVKNEASLNAGGKFEWIDSILIKCLQKGHWLLVDNVNLCSSAVLDRLNALLEPHGVLTIGERGVDQNGAMYEITPHSDFRLFLTMDPKNGEISRAMRNRGVEIYLLNEKETGTRNEFDTKSLINLEGLNSKKHIGIILKTHDFITELILGEKPTINELLQFASLVNQQIFNGFTEFESVSTSAIEIYFKSRSKFEFTTNDIVKIIQDKIKDIISENDETFDWYHTNISLKCTSLQNSSAVEKIKQHSSLIVNLVPDLNNPKEQNYFKFLLVNYYTISTQKELKMRFQYLQNILPQEAQVLNENMYQEISKNNLITNITLPQDLRWISVEKETLDSNILHLTLLIQNKYFSFVKKSPTSVITLLDYMNAREKKTTGQKYDDIIIIQFLNIIKHFDNSLKAFLSQITYLQNTEVIKILDLLTWRFRFFACSQIDIKKLTPTQVYNMQTNLKVHYKWFYKYSLLEVFKLLKMTPTKEFTTLLAQINENLEHQFSTIYKLGKNYQKNIDKPPPITSREDLDFLVHFHDVSQKYNICHKKNNIDNVLTALKHDVDPISVLKSAKNACLPVSNELTHLQDIISKEIEYSYDLPFQKELFVVFDYFERLQMRKYVTVQGITGEEYKIMSNSQILPVELFATLEKFNVVKDNRLLHEIYKNYFDYLLNSPSTVPNKFLALNDATFLVLNDANPKLCYILSQILMGHDLKNNYVVTKLGNFRLLQKQHDTLCRVLWSNFKQITEPEYDFLAQETNYLRNDFKTFVQQLSSFLGTSSNVNEIIQKISTLPHDKNLKVILTMLEKASNNLEPKQMTLDNVANVFMTLNYVKILLNSSLPLIDPLAKKALKNNYCADSIQEFTDLKQCYQLQNQVYSQNNENIHPLHKSVCDILQVLQNKKSDLEKYVAVRSSEVLYESVYKSVKSATSTILSPQYVSEATTKLDIRQNVGAQIGVIKNYEAALISYENLVEEWCNFSAIYPDVIEPLLCNLVQFLYGLRLKICSLKQLTLEQKQSNVNQTLGKFLKFPTLFKVTGDNYMEYNRLNYQENAIFGASEYKILKINLQETFNNCALEYSTNNTLKDEFLSNFNDLVHSFVRMYNAQEQKREQKEREDTSLYKMKTLCETVPEEVLEQKELKELFPSYHDSDFADFQTQNDLDNDSNVSIPVETPLEPVITHDDLRFVIEMHSKLLQNTTQSEWLRPNNKKLNHDFLSPLLEKFKLFKTYLDLNVDSLDYDLDKNLLGTFAIILNVVKNYGSTHDLQKTHNLKDVDFYKDPNVDEVKQCFHVLAELKLRLQELLNDWPEQATLQSILNVINRINDFEITSPVSRFLTGFEILLTKCNEWEQVAHSGVSLSKHAQEITAQVITWRKLELKMWKNLLNTTFNKLNASIPKWWLYLYNLSAQFVNDKTVSNEELIVILQQFLTKSSLAEFQKRLELIFVFHCHTVKLQMTTKSSETQSFLSILWNVYTYFKQFEPFIITKIKDLRTPIEKKLKDYVKIVKWKDISYWSVKETIDKSHKILYKHMREFREVMSQPVVQFLVNTSLTTTDKGIWDVAQSKPIDYSIDTKNYIAKKQNINPFAPKITKTEGVLSKIDSYFAKTRILCKDTLKTLQYPTLVQNLNDHLTDIIDTSTHLQKLEVDTTLPKNKQKSQAKSILQQKQRALSDLFKTLSKLGLSYRSGLIDSKNRAPGHEFLLKPIDLNPALDPLDKNDATILGMWESCQNYYVKTLMRLDTLESGLKNPAKDLGLQNIERCKGFSYDLISLMQAQKHELIKTSRCFYYLRHYLSLLRNFSEKNNFIFGKTLENLACLLKNLQILTEQLKIVLNTCPNEDFLNTQEAIPVLTTSQTFIQIKNDEKWAEADLILSETQSNITKTCSLVNRIKNTPPACEFALIKPNFYHCDNKELLQSNLESISTKIMALDNIFKGSCLSEQFSWLKNDLDAVLRDLDLEESTTSNNDDLEPQLEKLTENVLLVIQNLYKKHKSVDEQPQELEESNLQDNHLKKCLVEDLFSDLAALELKKLLNSTHKVVEIIFTQEVPCKSYQPLLIKCLPLLEQLALLEQYFMTQQVSSFRFTSKMTSILLNIFIDLASKGFCIPPELSDDMDEGGESKTTDAFGLTDGTGETDVSDKIESEDQLEEANPAGQEKDQNKDNDPDCKEEDKGIEMSDDFDSKLQDKEKQEGENSDDSNSDSDADEQMGETEKNAEKLDQEIWGSDQEEDVNSEGEGDSEKQEEKGEKGEQETEPELGANEDPKSKDEPQKQKDKGQDKEETKKDINELEEPEVDEEQNDPYHGNQPELPEPEAMDLPDDLQLDEGQDNDNNVNDDENPFDIDAMKEDQVPEDKTEPEDEDNTNKQRDEVEEFSEDEEDIEKKKGDEENPQEEDKDPEGTENTDDKTENVEENKNTELDDEENNTNAQDEGIDQTQTNEDNVEAMDLDNCEASDKTQATPSENQKSNQPIEETYQEEKPDQEGMGQSQMEESSTGHSAQTTIPQETQTSKRKNDDEKEKQQKPGESDSQRSLGDVKEPVKKKLKTMDDTKNDQNDPEIPMEELDDSSEMFKHIKEAQENALQVLDVATKEQVDQQKEIPNKEEEDAEKPTESQENLPEEDEDDLQLKDDPDTKVQKPEKPQDSKENPKKSAKKQHPKGDVLDEFQEIDVDGEQIDTLGVERGQETSHHTIFTDLAIQSAARLSFEEINSLRLDVESQLSSWNEPPNDSEAEQAWQKITSVTSSLAQDLSEQLRLVLEPTQASRLRGDFRTGRRINMRKVIPYIASQFRKDKIWLRRTKPSKREYQIVLAIDDSSSMGDNKSKELAFESVALISKALSLLESGQLSVLSFGETTQVLHKLTDQFTEKSGVKLLQKFKFDQNKTYVAKLVDFVTEMFAQSPTVNTTALNAKLLVIVSDGRGVFSEGETFVRQAVRRGKLSNIFTVFVIIDNPENKSSVLDIRMPVFKDGKLLGIKTYMDVFPFSFYIILRDINSLPNVLSDALRQWFEMVANLDKI